MSNELANLFTAISALIASVGVVVGGLWALYTGIIQRAFESGLTIDAEASASVVGQPERLVFLEVTLKNTGHRKLKVPAALSPDAFAEYEGSVFYPGDLEVKRILDQRPRMPYIDWWSSDAEPIALRELTDQEKNEPEPEKRKRHVPLLHEYELNGKGIEFFMEPDEECRVGVPLLLRPGHYLAKIVIVGERAGASEYWSRIVHVEVREG